MSAPFVARSAVLGVADVISEHLTGTEPSDELSQVRPSLREGSHDSAGFSRHLSRAIRDAAWPRLRISAATFRRGFLICLILLGFELAVRPFL
jgi:hypothetical protein